MVRKVAEVKTKLESRFQRIMSGRLSKVDRRRFERILSLDVGRTCFLTYCLYLKCDL